MKCAYNGGPFLFLKTICILIVVLGFVYAAKAEMQYDYVATTRVAHPKPVPVRTGKLVWACEGNRCRIRGPWPIPSVNACRALAKQVGFIKHFGHAGRYLSMAELNKCNAGNLVESPTDSRADQRYLQKPTSTARLSTGEAPAPFRERTTEAIRGKSPYIASQAKTPAEQRDVQNPALTSNPSAVPSLPPTFKEKPSGQIVQTPQDAARDNLRTIPFDLAIESVSKPLGDRNAAIRTGDRVPVQVSVRNRQGMAVPVIVVTTGNRPVLTKSRTLTIAPGARIEVPIELYVNPQHVHNGTFKTQVWLGTAEKPYVYLDANRENNIHEVIWSVVPLSTNRRFPFAPGVRGGGRSSSCDPDSIGTACQIQPLECSGRGAEWQVNGTYQCVSDELRCVARQGEDYCNVCGGNCGACSNASCSTANQCAPGSICVDNPALSPQPSCRNLNDDYVSRRTGLRVCTHIPDFCWTPDEVGQSEIVCREAGL